MEMILIKILFEQAMKYGLPGAMKGKVDNMLTFQWGWRIRLQDGEYELFNMDKDISVKFAEDATKFDPKKKKLVEEFTKDVFNIYTPVENDGKSEGDTTTEATQTEKQ